MIQCVIQLLTFAGYETVISLGFNPRLLFWAAIDIIKGKLGLSPVFIRAVGRPSEFAFLNTPSSYPGTSYYAHMFVRTLNLNPQFLQGFTAMFAQGETPFSLTPNLINPRVVFEIMSARPGRSLSNARCPLLVVTAQNDDIFPTRIADEIAEMAADSKYYECVVGNSLLLAN
jgi:pimeloyl-ACP methyl ester carboxylesterase